MPGFEIDGERLWKEIQDVKRLAINTNETVGRIDERQVSQGSKIQEHEDDIKALNLRVFGLMAGLVAAVGYMVMGSPL